jgi:hypothetical protein
MCAPAKEERKDSLWETSITFPPALNIFVDETRK